MQNRLKKLVSALAVGLSVVVLGWQLNAQTATGITPWEVGDVFVGVGSHAEAGGIYRTLDPTGTLKLDRFGVDPLRPVPDLLDTLHDLSSGCTVGPTVANGDMWTSTWTGMVLHRFS